MFDDWQTQEYETWNSVPPLGLQVKYETGLGENPFKTIRKKNIEAYKSVGVGRPARGLNFCL